MGSLFHSKGINIPGIMHILNLIFLGHSSQAGELGQRHKAVQKNNKIKYF